MAAAREILAKELAKELALVETQAEMAARGTRAQCELSKLQLGLHELRAAVRYAAEEVQLLSSNARKLAAGTAAHGYPLPPVAKKAPTAASDEESQASARVRIVLEASARVAAASVARTVPAAASVAQESESDWGAVLTALSKKAAAAAAAVEAVGHTLETELEPALTRARRDASAAIDHLYPKTR